MKSLLFLFILFTSHFILSQQTINPKLDSNYFDGKTPINLKESFDKPIVDSTKIKSATDSLVATFASSVKDLVSINNPFDKAVSKDTVISKIGKKIRKVDLSGNISIGYDYGLLTGYIDTSSSNPLNVIRSQADVSVTALGLPLNLSYNYSSFRNPLGVNNYFRISLDTEKLKEQARQKQNETIGQLDEKIESLQNGKEQIIGKMSFGEVLKQKIDKEITQYKGQLDGYEKEIASYDDKITNYSVDTSAVVDRGLDSLKTKSKGSKRDSLQAKYDRTQARYQRARELYNKVSDLYTKAKNLYDKYSNWEGELEKYKSKYDGYSNLLSEDGLEQVASDSLENRKQGLLSSIKTLDIGLTYPQTTALSSSNVPIKGVNLEVQRKKWYSAVVAGITMNNLMVSNDIVQNKLVYSQNLFNQFDFQEITQQGLLVSVKSGYGTTTGSHVFLGMRYLTNSKFSAESIGISNDKLIPSLGLELDTRISPKFLPETSIDLVYGKTSDSEKLVNGSRKDPFSSLFSSDRTNTGLLKITQPIKKIRSEFTGSFRWIDPQADVRSLGVLQPNNVRYELRSRHSISSRFRIGLNYRKDRNNVDNRLDTSIHLQVVGGQFSGNIGKWVNYFASLNYLTQSTSEIDNLISRESNYMYGAGITAQYKINDINNSIAFSYNDYLLTDTVSTGLFRNIGLQNMTQFDQGQNTFSIAYFKSELEDQEYTKAVIVGDEFSIQKDRFRLTLGIQIAFSDNYKRDAGGKLEVDAQITKFLKWSFKAEKLVLGDFYNSYDRDRFSRFPYVITTNLNFTLN